MASLIQKKKKTLRAHIWLHSLSLPWLDAATICADILFPMFQDGHQQNKEITKLKLYNNPDVYNSSFKVICDFQYNFDL